MLKKVLAVLMCCTMTIPSLASCGKKIDVSEKDSNVGIVNMTEPEKGDQIVIMNVKNFGEIKIRLFPEYADKGVENFVTLAKRGYYDNLIFHRIIKDFMIQGGDPTGTGMGGESIWGERFDGGASSHLINCTGALVYANSGSTATDGSQFYIVTAPQLSDSYFAQLENKGLKFSDEAKEIYGKAGGAPWLDGDYTVFGQVIDGLDVAFKMSQVAVGNKYKPVEDVVIESVKIGEYDGGQIRWYISDYE